MSLSRRVVEALPSLLWHYGRIATAQLYRRAFESIGPGTVIVSPRQLRGVDRIRIGAVMTRDVPAGAVAVGVRARAVQRETS